MQEISIKSLFEAGAHYGHRVRFWHPSNAKYVYGKHAGIHIINLDETIRAFKRACKFLHDQVAQGRQVLLVGTKRIAHPALSQAARACNMPYVDNRWLGGTLTNFSTVRQSVERLDRAENVLQDEKITTVYVKKEITKMRKNYNKLLRAFGGIRSMSQLPDILFVIDVGYESIAVAEARKLGIPVVGIVDTNHSCEIIDFPIPANDDSMRAVGIYLDIVSKTIIEAREEFEASSDSAFTHRVRDQATTDEESEDGASVVAEPEAYPSEVETTENADSEAAESEAAESDDGASASAKPSAAETVSAESVDSAAAESGVAESQAEAAKT